MKRTALFAVILPLALCACDENLTHPTERQEYDGGAAIPLSCLPNLDGAIDSSELTPTLGEDASYIVTPPLPADVTEGFYVNTAGAINREGRLVWDWSDDDPSHLVAKLRAEPLVDQWYANRFIGGQFAMPADLSGEVVAIYSHDETAMRLHGVASMEENPPGGQTLMVYQTPIEFFPFDLNVGKAWTQTGVVENGTLRGLSPWSQEDTYEVEVDAAGELRLPDFTFTQVLRVSTKVTISPKAGTQQGYTQRQVSFVFECFGEVARASSLLFRTPEDDPGKEFTTAHEIRRLGWF
ncbi:MAG: hypothetical protein JRI23_22390 [Deltaproteobacteria bacterium]|jgi:hypothetical protein|nr:hypothetical protein [Deltaproteobacteria bacterium]MBW2534696.1 hypothetical protein [Deltaproteobacteria bacterium]